MEKINGAGIEFDSKADYLGEQLANVHKRPFQYFTIQALKTSLLEALNKNETAQANAITKELQSRSTENEAFEDRSLGTNERKHAPR